MDKKAVAEVKKLLTKNNCRIDKIRGCFVNEAGEIITVLNETFQALSEENLEKYCELLRKTVSGKIGKNLFNMEFPISEEMEGGKQAYLYKVLRSEFNDDALVQDFFNRVIANCQMAGKYLIVLAHGVYDIPAKTSDNQDLDDASDYVYLFMICSICPVTEVKEGLCFDAETGSFSDKRGDLSVQMPEAGFLFPAFNDRMPDIHSTLFFTKKEDERHIELMDGMIGAPVPETASDQNYLFNDLVEKTLGRGCDFESVKLLTDSVNELIKESKDDPEPLELGKTEVRRLLHESGATPQAMEAFEEAFDETVGEGKTFMAESVGGRASMQIKSPSVKISVKSDMSAMITTRVIDGREYLLIPVQDEIELNGIRILPQQMEQ